MATKMFPMQDGPWIPWWLAERLFVLYEKLFPGSAADQPLKRLAERGGFGWAEAAFMWEELRKKMPSDEYQAMVNRFREPPE